jgi:hypothetical protein
MRDGPWPIAVTERLLLGRHLPAGHLSYLLNDYNGSFAIGLKQVDLSPVCAQSGEFCWLGGAGAGADATMGVEVGVGCGGTNFDLSN